MKAHLLNRTSLRGVSLYAIVATLLVTPAVHATDYTFFSGNNIIYYDPDAGLCNNTETDTPNASIIANENAELVLKFFTDKGFSLAAAAGIAGNLAVESSLNPAKIQGGAIASDSYTPIDGVGFGLAQWTTGGRQQNLIKFASSKGTKITDLTMQLEFVWNEMNTSYKEVVSRLNGEKSDPVAAAVIFHGMTPNIESEGDSINPIFKAANPPSPGYESSGDTSEAVVSNRGGNARAFYNQYKGKIADGSGIATYTDTATSPNATPTCNSSLNGQNGSVGVGEGAFTDIGEVSGWANVEHNALATDRLFGDSMENDGFCAAIVSRVWHGQDIGYGEVIGEDSYAINMWTLHGASVGHADRNVKKGAILIYRSDSQAAGHVSIYLGDNKILNDGKIRDANFVEGGGWDEHYLGWIDPNDVGWNSVSASDDTLRAILSGY